MKTRLRSALLGTLVLFAAACSRDVTEPHNELLSEVPADTPYVFASSRPLPATWTEGMLRLQQIQLHEMALNLQELEKHMLAAQLAEGGTPDPAMTNLVRVVDALRAETAAALAHPDGIASIGLDPDGLGMVYGRGILPVVRSQIGDQARLESFVQRVEARVGLTAARDRLGAHAFRRIALGPFDLVVGIDPDMLTIAVLVRGEDPEQLARVFGDSLPEASLAAADTLQTLRKVHGFAGWGEGYVDLRKVLDIALGRRADPLTELAAAQGEPAPQPPANCLPLLETLVGGMPRYVAGISRADEEALTMTAILETSPAVAPYLQKLAAPVPGLGTPGGALFSVGAGVNLPEVRNGVQAVVKMLVDRHADCDWIDSDRLQAAMPQLNLFLGPMAGGIRGFNLRFDDLQLRDGQPDPASVKGRLLAMVDDPRGVMAMLSMVSPGLARLEVPADGTLVSVPEDLLPPGMLPLSVAMQDKSLLVVADSDPGAEATAAFSEPLARPAPILAVDYRFAALLERFGATFEQALQSMESDGAEEVVMLRDQLRTWQAYAEVYDRFSMVMYANEHGLVGDNTMYRR